MRWPRYLLVALLSALLGIHAGLWLAMESARTYAEQFRLTYVEDLNEDAQTLLASGKPSDSVELLRVAAFLQAPTELHRQFRSMSKWDLYYPTAAFGFRYLRKPLNDERGNDFVYGLQIARLALALEAAGAGTEAKDLYARAGRLTGIVEEERLRGLARQ